MCNVKNKKRTLSKKSLSHCDHISSYVSTSLGVDLCSCRNKQFCRKKCLLIWKLLIDNFNRSYCTTVRCKWVQEFARYWKHLNLPPIVPKRGRVKTVPVLSFFFPIQVGLRTNFFPSSMQCLVEKGFLFFHSRAPKSRTVT